MSADLETGQPSDPPPAHKVLRLPPGWYDVQTPIRYCGDGKTAFGLVKLPTETDFHAPLNAKWTRIE
jgi:hypothetical protein